MAYIGMRKDTWWNRLRVEKNLSFKDLSDIFGGCPSRYGNFFSGCTMPTDSNIEAICTFFDVNFDEGKKHFEEAHESYIARDYMPTVSTGERSDKGQSHEPRVVRSHLKIKRVDKSHKEIKTASWSELSVDKQNELTYQMGKILGAVYGKIDYLDFLQFSVALKEKGSDPAKFLYGKLSYEDYRLAFRLLAEWRLGICAIDLSDMDQ